MRWPDPPSVFPSQPERFGVARAESRFPRPTAIRQTLQTQASAIQEKRITTEDELLAAIASAPYGNEAGQLVCYGRAVVIAGDIAITKTIRLDDAQFSGLRITSLSRSRLYPAAQMDGLPLSVVEGGSDISIDNLSIEASASSRFSAVVEQADTCARLTISDLSWTADYLLLGGAFTASGFMIRGNRRSSTALSTGISARFLLSSIVNNVNASVLPITILNNSFRVSIANNVRLGDVEVQFNSQFVSITGNVQVGDIDTSASDGYNVVDGNVSCGTLSTHTTDALGLNT